MNKIYFRIDNDGICRDECKVKSCMIGSVKCQECEHLASHNMDENWVKCNMFYEVKNDDE